MQALATQRQEFASRGAAGFVELALYPLQWLLAAPALLFIIALSTMLLCHPEVPLCAINRIAFAILVLAFTARILLLRDRLFVGDRALLPMLALTLLTLTGIVGRPFDKEAWSLLGTKYAVPFAMFYIATKIFTTEKRFRQFEMFAICVLAYLSFIAIAFLLDARSLIFPKYILDANLGYHADRARGPFLQAVANGMSLNLLGLLALHAYRRESARGIKMLVLLVSVPTAILATMTRAVWLSFAGSVLALIFLAKNRAIRRAAVGLSAVVALAVGAMLTSEDLSRTLRDRFMESSPVAFRQAVYAGSWQMFLERPLAGWGFHSMPEELPRYVSEFHGKQLYPHNTYLELLVEQGMVGLTLYVWLMWELLRLRRGPIPKTEQNGFLDEEFHRFWPILLGVYWINAAFVVMNYQFVNALLFAMAGMLAAQRKRAEAAVQC